MYWKSPKDGRCCECRPQVCDPCDACPTAESVEVTVSGIAACCTVEGSRMIGLGSVNGVHALMRELSGEYTLRIAGAVQVEWYAEADCETLFSTDAAQDVTLVFSCDASSAVFDIRLSDSDVRLFFVEITPPAPGELFVFGGASECSGFVPFTFGGTVTVG